MIILCPYCKNSISSETDVCIYCKNVVSKIHSSNIPHSFNNNITQQIPTVGDWIINFLLLIIPIIGLIFLIIWANDDTNLVRKNWAVATLIWMAILFVLILIFYSLIFAAFMNAVSNSGKMY